VARQSPKSDRPERAPSLAATVIADLSADRPVRVELPGGGRLHLERRLPMLCVYRNTADDAGTDQLLSGEPVYMIVPAGEHRAQRALKLLRTVVEFLAKEFGSFLLIEVWSERRTETSSLAISRNGDSESQAPRFEIAVPGERIPRPTTEALCQSLGRDVLPFGGAHVALGPYEDLAPPGFKPLLRLRECRDWNCFALGIVVRPEFRTDDTQEINPTAMHSMSRDLHIALEQANFAFVRQRKTLRPAHFHAPGHRSVVKAVLDIDRQLAEIDRSFDLLLQATPVNAESAWREFRRSRFDKPPVFYYRPLAVDPVLLKRQLFLIPVERVEDPTLSYLFRQKQDELDRQITLLSDVDSPRFLHESLQVYGGVSDWLLTHAKELLDRVPTRSGEGTRAGQLNATEFAKRAQEELGYYQQRCSDFAATVSVRDDMYAGLMVSGDRLLIGGRTRVARSRVDALLQHEIGTHLVTRYNGHHQPFQQFEVGLAGYDGFQEGLAVLAEYLVGGLSRFRLRVLAARVVGAHLMLDGASFIDTFRTLDRNFEFSQRTAYTIAMRLYRGGGLTKDAVYLRGLLQILRYLREGGELEPLFIGKVASAHLPLIAELSMREIIKPPALRPRYLEGQAAQKKIVRLRGGLTVLELVQP
jgi:uncharacterized protein (TIGR02421 family)